jgi:hypothetical protein
MRIMPAGVHYARVLRFIRHIVSFGNRQRIHIGTQATTWSDGLSPFIKAYQPGICHFMIFQGFPALPVYLLQTPMFLPREKKARVGVQVPAVGHYIIKNIF